MSKGKHRAHPVILADLNGRARLCLSSVEDLMQNPEISVRL
ncbi:hypothetical protein [Leptodesmis sp.]